MMLPWVFFLFFQVNQSLIIPRAIIFYNILKKNEKGVFLAVTGEFQRETEFSAKLQGLVDLSGRVGPFVGRFVLKTIKYILNIFKCLEMQAHSIVLHPNLILYL